MNLDDLLKKPEFSSPWKAQRKNLLRLAVVAAICGCALILVAILASRHSKQDRLEKNPKSEAELSALMRIQRDVNHLRNAVAVERDKVTTRQSQTDRLSRSRLATGSEPQHQLIDFDPGDGFANVSADKQKVYIPTGAVFLGRLLTPIKTSVERTFVMAETTREFRMDMKRRILKGSRLIGRSRLNPVLKGVVVEFDTIVSPTGIESSISGLALSRNALPEIEGLYFSDRLQTYGAALAFGFLGGLATGAENVTPTLYGPIPPANLHNEVLSGLGASAFQISESMLRDIQQQAIEYVVVPAGQQIFIALTRRYDVTPEGHI